MTAKLHQDQACNACGKLAPITEGDWCSSCINYGPPERWPDCNEPEVCDFCGHYLASNGSCNHCEAVEFDDDDPTDLSVLSEDCLYDNYSSDSC
jgi:hypothetical protein